MSCSLLNRLAKRGYDVWLPNSRGNTYSRNHTTLDPDCDKEFWDFSFDEMIKYDAPTVVDYVLNQTGRLTVGFVGHSMGTTIMFGLLASQPKYNSIMKPCIAMAPITVVGHSYTPYTYLAHLPVFVSLIKQYGGPFLPSNYLMRLVADKLCSSRLKWFCSNAVFMANGFNEDQMNMTRLGVYTSGMPAGTSSKNMIHFAQAVLSHKFSFFDYGKKKNQVIYGDSDPPEYPLNKVTSRHVIIFWSQNDWLSSEKDVRILTKKLPVFKNYKIPIKDWNHIDFILGKSAAKYVNSPILTVLHKYNLFK